MKKLRRLYVVDYMMSPRTRFEHGAVLCEGEKIIAIGGVSSFTPELGMEIYTFENAYAIPGFIDSHIHGAGGFDCSSAATSPCSIEEMSTMLAQHGVTSFVPTVTAAPHTQMLQNLEYLSGLMERSLPGADACGIHVEGPFINPEKRGAQDAASIIPVDLGFIRELIASAHGKIKLMTFAPELDHAVELVECLCENGIAPSMGHSIADDVAALRAIDAGARRCTHLFNGMPPLHQRNMNITSIALTDRRVIVEMILDGRHINPRMVDLACRCKLSQNMVGISDCTMATGMPDGIYRIGPTVTRVENGFSRTDSGALAGTTATLDIGWHSLMSYGHVPETQAAQAVTQNAARGLGLTDRGKLLPRLRADLAIFERGTNRPLMTVRRGEIVYRSGSNLQYSEAD